MDAKKTLGTTIIGVAITLAIALIPLIIWGDDPLTGTAVGPAYNVQLEGKNLFVYLLFIGLSIVAFFVLKDSTKTLRSIFLPTIVGTICGILSGILFPARQINMYVVYEFNKTVFIIIFGFGIFISLITLGIYLQKRE